MRSRVTGSARVAIGMTVMASRRVSTLNFASPAIGCADGYGNATEQIIFALERQGVRCIVDWTSRPVGDVRALEVLSREYEEGDARLYFVQPYAWDRRTRAPIYGYTMYESDRLPDMWFHKMGNVDELWVPSRWNQEVFAAATGREVHLVPLGVNSSDFPIHPRQRKHKLQLLHFATQAGELRKGTDLAIRAFAAAFQKRRDASLTIRSTWDCSIDTSDTRIALETGPISTLELAAFYNRFDALIFPSRSEGFGMIPLEFMATGAPAIYTDATGMHDYSAFGLPVSAKPSPAQVGVGRGIDSGEFGSWFEPNFDEVVDRLQEVDKQYDAVQARAVEQAAQIATEWSWDRTAECIIERFEYRLGR
jgi:glycosyltransferase involved in cell wall biosynthesis